MSIAGRLQGPTAGASARHRPVRPRPALAGHDGRRHLDPGRRDRGGHRHAASAWPLGMLSGYFGGWLDEGFMRLVDAVQGFPAILSALLFAAVFRPERSPSAWSPSASPSCPSSRGSPARSFLELRDRDFVVAARALGAGDGARHRPPHPAQHAAPAHRPGHHQLPGGHPGRGGACPTWGSAPSPRIRRGASCCGRRRPSSASNPWFAIFPGGAIALTVLGLNLLGDGLRDLLDPKTVDASTFVPLLIGGVC